MQSHEREVQKVNGLIAIKVGRKARAPVRPVLNERCQIVRIYSLIIGQIGQQRPVRRTLTCFSSPPVRSNIDPNIIWVIRLIAQRTAWIACIDTGTCAAVSYPILYATKPTTGSGFQMVITATGVCKTWISANIARSPV
jgi:hypothetical protein